MRFLSLVCRFRWFVDLSVPTNGKLGVFTPAVARFLQLGCQRGSPTHVFFEHSWRNRYGRAHTSHYTVLGQGWMFLSSSTATEEQSPEMKRNPISADAAHRSRAVLALVPHQNGSSIFD
jgi:hypothetical protein